jgi:hypothetical protein
MHIVVKWHGVTSTSSHIMTIFMLCNTSSTIGIDGEKNHRFTFGGKEAVQFDFHAFTSWSLA